MAEQSFFIRAPRRTLTSGEVRDKYYRLTQQRTTIERLARELEADEAALRQAARDAGHGRLLRELESPPALPPAEPRARYRVLRPYRLHRQGPHGPEQFSCAAGGVMDLPIAVAKQLGDRVEPVGRDVPIQGRPLESWMSTD